MRAGGGICTLADVHAHLFDCADGVLGDLVEEAAAAGVGAVINTAVSIGAAATVLEQCARFPQNLKAAVGVSPFDAVDAEGDWAERLLGFLAESPSVIAAIGEIGLDCTNPRYPPLDAQMPFFVRQLEIAADADLPAVIHSRGMEKRTAEICNERGVKKAVFHCFTGDREALEYITGCGYYVSISGILTYKNSHLPEMLPHIPADKLLIETDAPYLSPVPHRGKPNRPAYLIHTAKAAATILEVTELELAERLRENTAAAFQRWF